MLDVLLVNPNNRILSPYAATEPPLWAGLIASHYRKEGQEVAILDAEAGDLTVEQTVEAVRNSDPRVVLIVVMGNNPSASSTPKMKVTKELVVRLRGFNVAVTGLHPSALPEETEAELGVSVLKGKIFDGMPNMPWDLLPMNKYRAHNWQCLDGSPREPYASVYTSLGCPFDCSFCNIHALYGGKREVWYREPRLVAQEIDRLVVEHRVRNIKFWDELFTLNKDHVEEICDRLIRRLYDLNIWAYARVDSVTTKMLGKMRQAGVRWVCYGVEAGNQDILGSSNKRANKLQAQSAVRMAHYADINVLGNFIFGLPGDTEETMQETLEFAKSLEVEYANFYVAKAYPGSKLQLDNKDWASYSQFGEDGSEANKFRDRAFGEFFSDRAYLARVWDRFGGQAVGQIKGILEFGKPITRGA